MERNAILGIMLTLMLTSMFTLTFSARQVRASEPPSTQWTKTYGGTGSDTAHSVIQTSDGGYALAGYTWSFGTDSRDFWLVKVGAESPPPVPEFPLGGAMEMALILGIVFLWVQKKLRNLRAPAP